MIITILGAGNIGSTLGKKWLNGGHEIVFGVRDVNSLSTQAALQRLDEVAQAVDISRAISEGDVILFSVPWGAVPEIASANAAILSDKILIDATNHFAGPVINNLAALKKSAPRATIYRAFNSLGWELFNLGEIRQTKIDHFYTGPDGSYRAVIEGLISEAGLRPIWVGDNDKIEIVDHLGALWVELAIRQGWGRMIGLKLLEG